MWTGHGDLYYLQTAIKNEPLLAKVELFLLLLLLGGVSKVVLVKLPRSVGHRLIVKIALSKISGLIYQRCKISIFLF